MEPRMNQTALDMATSAPAATGSALLAYGFTLSDWVMLGWIFYIAVCVLIKIPNLIESIEKIYSKYRVWRKGE